jgi:WD40 repeat protein
VQEPPVNQATEAALSNPYVGPRAFTLGERLYGREREVRKLLNLLVAERVVLLCSPSGAGKTSLIQASLIPLLDERSFHVLPVMRVSQDLPIVNTIDSRRPVNRYILSLLLSLEEALPAAQQLPLADLLSMSFADYLDRHAATISDGEVLIFDQFEEILTIDPTNRDAKLEFFTQVGAALRDRRRWALFAMREDYLAALDSYLRPIPTQLTTTFRLDLLGAAAARDAIQRPALGAGVAFADAAADQLVDDLRRVRVQRADGTTGEQLGDAIEPVQLQVVCYRLWERLRAGATRIVESDVAAVGDVDSALGDYYTERVAAIAAASGLHERAIRDWCEQRLITDQDIRGQVLQGVERSDGLANHAIGLLVDTHLVRAEKRRGATWFELAHDRLIAPIRKRNAAWREAHLSTLQRQAALWEQQDRSDGLLLRGATLTEAQGWAGAHADNMTESEQDFLAVCLAARAVRQRERRSNRLIRALAVVASIITLIAVVLLVLALRSADRATQSAALADRNADRANKEAQNAKIAADSATQARGTAEAEEQRAKQAEADTKRQSQVALARQLSAQVLTNLAAQPQRSLLLAVEAISTTQELYGFTTAEAEAALHQALVAADGTSIVDGILGFSPDARWLARVSRGGDILLQDVTARRAPSVVRRGLNFNDVQEIAVSSDGRRLVAVIRGQPLHLWDATNPDNPAIELTGTEAASLPAFSPDGQKLVANVGQDIWLWNVDNLTTTLKVWPQVTNLDSAPFSPDGRWMAVRDPPGNIELLDIGSLSEQPLALPAGQLASNVAFSPDGHWVALGDKQQTVWLWDLTNLAAEPLHLNGPKNWVTSLAFSHDSRRLVAGSQVDIRMWQLADFTVQELAIPGLIGDVRSLAFSPDDHWLAIGSWDTFVRLLNMDDPGSAPIELRGQVEQVVRMKFSADGRLLFSTGGTTWRWQLGGSLADELAGDGLALRGHARPVMAAGFSSDQRRLATASEDGTIRLWDTHDLSLPQAILNHTTGVYALAFSPDGHRLAIGDGAGATQLLDIDRIMQIAASQSVGGRRSALLQPSEIATATLVLPDRNSPPAGKRIKSVVFSPDGHLVASGGEASRVQIWSVADMAAPLAVHTIDTPVLALAFSPDNRWLATANPDGTVWVWDAHNPDAKPNILNAAKGQPVRTLAFSADGRWLVTVNAGADARWDTRQFGGGSNLQPILGDTIEAVSFGEAEAASPLNADDAGSGSESVVLRGAQNTVVAMAFSPGGRWLATGARDNTVRLWQLQLHDLVAQACHTSGRNLSAAEWSLFIGDRPYRKTCPDVP